MSIQTSEDLYRETVYSRTPYVPRVHFGTQAAANTVTNDVLHRRGGGDLVGNHVEVFNAVRGKRVAGYMPEVEEASNIGQRTPS